MVTVEFLHLLSVFVSKVHFGENLMKFGNKVNSNYLLLLTFIQFIDLCLSIEVIKPKFDEFSDEQQRQLLYCLLNESRELWNKIKARFYVKKWESIRNFTGVLLKVESLKVNLGLIENILEATLRVVPGNLEQYS